MAHTLWRDKARQVCSAVLAVTAARVVGEVSARTALDALAQGRHDAARRQLLQLCYELEGADRAYSRAGATDDAFEVGWLLGELIPIAYGPGDESVLSELLDDSEPMLSAERDARESEPAGAL